MTLEVKLGERLAQVELISEKDSQLVIKVDDKIYDIDALEVEKGVYSILYNNKSYNVELIKKDSTKKYTVNTIYNSFDAEIVDADAKYQQARTSGDSFEADSTIISPMPGKVVRITVKEGDVVKKGDTVIIIAAMKMESEYKAMKDGKISEIFVTEEDTVDGNQPLIKID